MKMLPVLSALVLACPAIAFPLSYKSTVSPKTNVPLIVVSVSLFLLLVAVKLVYMKHRRLGTIHSPSGTSVRSAPTDSDLSSSTSSFGLRDKQRNRHRGLLVGFLGSPTWETNLTSRLDGVTWRRAQRRKSSSGYQRHVGSSTHSTRSASMRTKVENSSASSRFTKSTVVTGSSIDADQLVLPLLSGHSRIPSSSRSLCSVQRSTSIRHHSRYGDFGESNGVKSARGSVPKATRRASPSSIRLVDGPAHSGQVEYSFLSGLPPDSIVVSPLMGTRDSFQLSRCSLKCNGKPAPPLPPLPSFLPFHLPKDSEALESYAPKESGYLPTFRFSPLASVAKVFHSQQQASERKVPGCRTPNSDENDKGSLAGPGSAAQNAPPLRFSRKTNVTSRHRRSRSYRGLAIEGTSPRTTLVGDEATPVLSLPLESNRLSAKEPMQTGVLRTPSGSSRDGSVGSKKLLKSCLRQNAVAPPVSLVCSPDMTLTPSISEAGTQTCTRQSAGDHMSLRTPISDVDIGILGLDRFQWNDEIKELKVRSSHMRKDSVALVPHWE